MTCANKLKGAYVMNEIQITLETVRMFKRIMRPIAEEGIVPLPEYHEAISQLTSLAEHGRLKPVIVPKLIDQKEAAEMLGIGHSNFKRLESGKVATVSELAQKVKQERAFLFRALSLVNLAPDIIEAILNGKEPATLTLSKLRKGFPEDWDEQRKMFGIE